MLKAWKHAEFESEAAYFQKDVTGEKPHSEDFRSSASVSNLKRKAYVPKSFYKYSSSKNRFILLISMTSIYPEKLSQGSYISYFTAVALLPNIW